MRLIEVFPTEAQAFLVAQWLKREGISSAYERRGKDQYALWIEEEDDLQRAQELIKDYQAHPEDPRFKPPEIRQVPPLRNDLPSLERSSFRFSLTHCILFVCIGLFFWGDLQEEAILDSAGPLGKELEIPQLEQALLFDLPQEEICVQKILKAFPLKEYGELKTLPAELQEQLQQAETIPTWKGLISYFKTGQKGPLFERIRQGEIWRLFTPCFLHADFFHILFNMAWVWILLPQVERRLKWVKSCLLLIGIGVIANIFQYLISGPYFLGFSGIIVGIVGFIWMRQKKAPWEGYPLSPQTSLFILVFILAMFFLEGISWLLLSFSLLKAPLHIANTAHLVGGLTGLLLGSLPLFERSRK